MYINLIEYFERTVELLPEKIAVSDAKTSLTFLELSQKSRNLGARLTSNPNTTNCPIAIYLPKSNDFMVSILATLYSGNCYAPLDVKNPISRIKSILEVLKPILIITNTAHIKDLKKLELKIDIVNIDDLEFVDPVKIQLNYNKCIDTDTAYIMHTSGSTGIPKGVVISHRSIIDYIHWAITTFDISHNEIIGNQAPFIFDNSTLDIYLMIFTGATLNLIPEHLFAFPIKLVEYLKVHQVNFIFWVPSALVGVANFNGLDTIKLPLLKKVLFCGEVMPTKHLNYWIRRLEKEVIYANLYGPTEITDACTYYIIDRTFDDTEVLPIGRACRNTDIIILNNQNKTCEVMEHGELCVRGSSLSSGYWNNPEKTNSAFVQNPLNTSYPEKIYRTGDIVYRSSNGEIMFVGRKDFQIKHLGYRIELGEIEHAVLRVFSALEACIVYDEAQNEIVLVYETQEEIPISVFRVRLSEVLSKYMIPTKYLKVDRMPKNSSGKIDRNHIKKIVVQ